jgi:hypothetical protein
MKERTLLDKLKRVYQEPVKADLFGRRPALPSEVQAVLRPTFEQQIDVYLPTSEDIEKKGDD